jgi:hypothetical protein
MSQPQTEEDSPVFTLSQEEGELLVNLARAAVEEYLSTGEMTTIPTEVPDKLQQRCGVFVTICDVKQGRKSLRGCIGYPYPTTMLAQAVIECAISSATRDPRFPPLTLEDLDHTVFEVSVLTPPETLEVEDPRHLPRRIKVGRDGLIVERGFHKGLLLPQVPVEYGWDEEDFLCQCCVKAGVPPDNWLLKTTTIQTFHAIVFEEKTPRGEVSRKQLGGN